MNADPADFSPPLLRIQEKPAPPLAGDPPVFRLRPSTHDRG